MALVMVSLWKISIILELQKEDSNCWINHTLCERRLSTTNSSYAISAELDCSRIAVNISLILFRIDLEMFHCSQIGHL